ncbi:MAG: CDP-alcohol phosphatidyltransferase family protein [Candidatus Woesearchaeota archaeon]
MVLANLLSLFRIVTVPLMIYFIYLETSGFSFVAIILMFLAFISDLVDGYIARKRKDVTKMGSFLDPFADKILVVCMLFVFFLRDSFSIYYLGIFILRDVIFLIFRSLASREDLVIKQEKKFSNVVVNSQFILVFTLILRELFVNTGYQGVSFTGTLVTIFTIVSIIMAIGSVLMYWLIYSRLVKTRQRVGKLVKKEKMIILANKKSRGYQNKFRRKLLEKFSERRKAKLVFLPQTSDMYHGAIKKINGAKHIIIAGGDGSFESALSYKPFWNKCLGFFPFGAGNAYYSLFFKGKKFEYLRSRFKFSEVLMDVLEVEYNDKTFQTTFLTAGIDSEVPRLTEERTENGFTDYVNAAWKGLKNSRAHYDLVLKIDGKTHHLKNCVTLTLAKIPFFGYGLRSLTGATNINDGYTYGLAIVNKHTKLSNKPLRIWAFLLTHLNMERDPLLPLKGKEFVVECKEPFPLQAGGEFLGFTQKIKVKVIRQQKVLMI